MLNTTCVRCGTTIVDDSSVVEADGNRYCCASCAAVATGRVHPATPGRPQCAHCQVPIVDTSSRVDRDGATYCCPNCATAASHRAVIPS